VKVVAAMWRPLTTPSDVLQASVLRDFSVRERNGFNKGKREDVRGSVDPFNMSRVSNIEVFAHLEGMHLDVNPRFVQVKIGAACAVVTEFIYLST
jgi:hypothetical protein